MTEQDLYELRMEFEQEMKEEQYVESMMRADYDYCLDQYISDIQDAYDILAGVKKQVESYGWEVTIQELINYV